MANHACSSRCPAGCHLSRRIFLGAASASIAASVLGGCASSGGSSGDAAVRTIQPMGPASRCVPSIRAAFVRRKEDYGMLWPGAVYDGNKALASYTQQIQQAAAEMKLKLDIRPAPIYSAAEADAWVKESVDARPDGLLLVVLDRQLHSWPTAAKAANSGIPTVIFSPVGTSFTTNTESLAEKPGCFICSTDDFSQVRYGMKMMQATAKLKATRCLVIAGNKTVDRELPHLGIQLHYVPAATFLEMYRRQADTAEILSMADDLVRQSRGLHGGATRRDVVNGIKSYVVAREMLEREQADAISMDCLGALGKTDVSLPCIAWAKMNDDRIPAACEADVGAIATHCMVQYLFDRPGFQQDPVADTVNDAVIGAHCSCPTRLNGFGTRPEPYDIVHHHGMRDATARTRWPEGQRVTMADVLPGDAQKRTQIIIAGGSVMDNVSVPPAGGCVISVRVKFDSSRNVLAFPGFHQLFFYGDYKRELVQFCKFRDVDAVVA